MHEFRAELLNECLERVTYRNQERSFTAFLFDKDEDEYLIIMDKDKVLKKESEEKLDIEEADLFLEEGEEEVEDDEDEIE